MAKKIDTQEDSLPQEDPALIKRVDKMMDPSAPEFPNLATVDEESPGETDDSELDSTTSKAANTDEQPLDIFANTAATAPLLAKKADKVAQDEKKDDQVDEVGTEEETSPANDQVVDSILSQPQDEEEDDDDQENSNDQTADLVKSNKSKLKVAIKPDEYDDPKLSEVISDIVAQESDEVLLAEDNLLVNTAENSQPLADDSSSHPIFWILVAIVCLVAIAIALFLVDPNIYHFLKKIHFKSL